ncbi:MAG: hypothetical protein VX424_02230 [Actinomycetota bacterium]|nr:hypothetical protein [Actinomycetota bacterium]
MGLYEDMQRQQAALNAKAKQRVAAEQARSRQLQDEASEKKRFLSDFVREAQARGIRPTRIPLYYATPGFRFHEKKSSQLGWVVYVTRSGKAKYAIGVDGVLYEGRPAEKSGWGHSKKPHPVEQAYFHRVPWADLTQVLLGHPPAMEPPNDYD